MYRSRGGQLRADVGMDLAGFDPLANEVGEHYYDRLMALDLLLHAFCQFGRLPRFSR